MRLATAVVLSAATLSSAQTPQAPGPQGGPYFHVVMSASSRDGLTWTHDGRVLLEHASVPAALALPDGRIRIYYVDAANIPETANVAESTDGGASFEVRGLTIANRGGIKALDPSIVALPDGRFRLYYYASATANPSSPGVHAIHAAISEDGISFRDEGPAFDYPSLVDPDVFWSGREWLMYVFGDGGTLMARSDDGRSFSYLGPLPLDRWGTTAPVRLDDGRLRLYAFQQGRKPNSVGSFLSEDGLAWEQEPGVRLDPPPGHDEITDPFVVRLPDGSWKMFYKVALR